MALQVQNGFLHVGRVRGTPVGIHVLYPLGALWFGGFRFDPLAWVVFGLVILAHEFGHAALVRLFGAEVVAVHLTPTGGECSWRGNVSELRRSYISWGGVLAQLLVYMAAAAFDHAFGPFESPTAWKVLYLLTTRNLHNAAFNLLPIPPLDGSKAWVTPVLLYRRWRWRRSSARAAAANSASLRELSRRDKLDQQPADERLAADVDAMMDSLRAKSRKGEPPN